MIWQEHLDNHHTDWQQHPHKDRDDNNRVERGALSEIVRVQTVDRQHNKHQVLQHFPYQEQHETPDVVLPVLLEVDHAHHGDPNVQQQEEYSEHHFVLQEQEEHKHSQDLVDVLDETEGND